MRDPFGLGLGWAVGGLVGGGGAGFTFDNAEAETLVAAMSVEPDDTRKGLIDDLVGSLKTAGVWAKLDCLWVTAAHDSQAATLNWKNPGTADLTVGGGAPTFLADRHYATDGSDDWLDTNFNPTTFGGVFATANCTVFAGNRLEGTTIRQIGWFDGTDGFSLGVRTASNTFSYRMQQAAERTAGTSTTSVGLYSVSRTAGNATTAYFNGALVDTGAPAATPLNNANFRIGAITAASFGAGQHTCAGVGSFLDATEHDALWDALNTYMAAVGAWSI